MHKRLYGNEINVLENFPPQKVKQCDFLVQIIRLVRIDQITKYGQQCRMKTTIIVAVSSIPPVHIAIFFVGS